MVFITALKLARLKTGIAQWKLGMLSGIHQSVLSTYEVGRVECPSDARKKLAKILSTAEEDLFPKDEKKRCHTHLKEKAEKAAGNA